MWRFQVDFSKYFPVAISNGFSKYFAVAISNGFFEYFAVVISGGFFEMFRYKESPVLLPLKKLLHTFNDV